MTNSSCLSRAALLTAFISIFSSSMALADQLAVITNDRNGDKSTLSTLPTDGGPLAGFIFVTEHASPAGTTHKTISLADVASPNGAVLDGDASHNVIILKGLIDPNRGANNLEIRYLSNGLTGSYSQCTIEIAHDGAGNWFIAKSNGQRVSNVRVKTWALGVSNLEGLCD